MRIITGEYKGRKIEMPESYNIRPTTEKVKEAIFSTVQSYIYDATVCDLFCGTGNLGLEALSRGANKCYFCDNSRESLALTKRNIENCKAENKSIIIPGDYEKALARLKESGVKVDIFILDPPYREGLYENCFKLIKDYELLNDDGIIIAEHETRDSFNDEILEFKKWKEKKYGNISVSIYVE